MNRLEWIREQERLSHTEAYTKYDLYQQGSWLKQPVKTVLDLLPCFERYSEIRVLDLGCGVGRNSIAIATHFRNILCRIDCVDILELAIEKLLENARRFDVYKSIHGISMPLEAYPIADNYYDLLLGISALEHVESKETLVRTLKAIRDGVRENGIVCLIVNSDVHEFDRQTGQELPAQFEVNLPHMELQAMLDQTFDGWTVLKSSFQEQQYDIPRGSLVSKLHTNVVTFVARKR